MINATKCNNCVHQPVCKESEDYIKIFNVLNDFGVRDRIDGELRCKHYVERITWKETNDGCTE